MNKENKVYISGRISGMEEESFNLFRMAEMVLKDMGFEVVNPFGLAHNHDKTWESYMRTDIKAMMDCGLIFKLPGWQMSKGAVIESNLANELGMKEVKLPKLSVHEI